MASNPATRPITAKDVTVFGEVIHYRLTKEYPDNYNLNPDEMATTRYNAILHAIEKIYKDLKILGSTTGYEYLAQLPSVEASNGLAIGDIIYVNDRIYAVTGESSAGWYRTYPKLADDDDYLVNYVTPKTGMTVRRPPVSNATTEVLAEFTAEITSDEVLTEVDAAGGSFRAVDIGDNSSHFQIGDIVVGVDPVQISFTTQNGYQIFPTVRSQGNPKLPTMQQIKNIHVVLMFPNEDAINFQLLPIFAMFKRAPYVNIKNKDITTFFSEIASSTGWIPVALESIHITSIDGFPNSIQAEINFLPFDPSFLGGNGFRALKTMKDVWKQQEILYKDRNYEALLENSKYKLRESEVNPERFKELQGYTIDTTENFKASLPFRVFYQSLIADHKYVRDEFGNYEQVLTGSDVRTFKNESLQDFAPTKRHRLLRHYKARGNRELVSLRYKYVEGDYQKLREFLSGQRIDNQDETLRKSIQFFNTVKDYKGLSNVIFSTFQNRADALREYEYEFSRVENTINTVLTMHGWNVEMVEPATGFLLKPGRILDFIFKSILHSTNIRPAWTNFQSALKAGSVIINGKKKNFDLNPANNAFHDWLGANLVYNDINTGELSKYGIKTIDGAMKTLWDWVSQDERRKKQLILIMQQIADGVLRGLDSAIVLTDIDSDIDSPYTIKRLPIKTEDVVIDGEDNVITNWSITFSNKFVPFYLQAYKYPYYQHLGSEDASVSLRLRSVPNSSKYDLKAKLSQLSDRMYDSVKLVVHQAPDLYTWLDPRVEVVSHPNSIFNAFGIHKVVVNAANTTNVQGKPDSWNTVLNLTQAEFSLDQYMSLESKQSFSDIEGYLVQLIPRLKLDASGRWHVRSYMKRSTSQRTANTEGTEAGASSAATGVTQSFTAPDIEDILFMSLLDSTPGGRVIDHIRRLVLSRGSTEQIRRLGEIEGVLPGSFLREEGGLTGSDLIDKLFSQFGDVMGSDLRADDPAATNAINEVTSNNSTFNSLLKSIVRSYEALISQQSDMLLTVLQKHRGYWSYVAENLNSPGQTTGDKILFGGLALLFKNSFLGPVGNALANVGLGITAAIGLAQSGTQVAAQKLRDELSVFLNSLANTIKKELLLNLAKSIVKDPIIRKKLLDPKVLYGEKYDPEGNRNNYVDPDKQIQERLDAQSYNCYGDFDIPISKVIGTKIKRTIKLSPDFWIFNPFEQDKEIKEFVTENTKRIMQTNKIAAQTSLVTHKDALERFDRVIKFLQGRSNELNDQDATEVDLRGFNLLDSIKKELGYEGNLRDSYIGLVQKYVSISMKGNADLSFAGGDKNSNSDANITRTDVDAITGADRRSTGPEAIWGGSLSEETRKEILSIYDEANEDNPNKEFVKIERDRVDYFLKLGMTPRFDNRDKIKLSVVWSQRMITLIELLEIFTSMESYFSKQPQFADEFKQNFTSSLFEKLSKNSSDLQLVGASNNALRELRNHVTSILRSWQFVTSKDLERPTDDLKPAVNVGQSYDSEDIRRLQEIKEKYRGGVYHPTTDKEYLQIPDIRQFQEFVYNKIGYYVRLNTVIAQYNHKLGPNQPASDIDLNLLPELKFLDYWNTRTLESSFRKIRIMDDFLESVALRKRLNTRMFPTFKLLFIEEDTGRTQILDDYYAYNAVQSIEIVKNKHHASSTAVLKVNNLIGTITDRLSFHRERSDWLKAQDPFTPDDVFFGTLDVKPGTRVQIKLGYSADDKQLSTIFNGRIIEMNAGPVTEMVCQSFGAQLNHKLYAEKFGMTASEKEHGDIASSLLDRIPGLEMLGKRDVFNTGVTTTFGGKNMNKIRRDMFDIYLMSNVLGKVSASALTTDNPRDENIYLPYDLSTFTDWDPKFSWVVYDQTVWEALKELCLYHRNVIPIIKPYNNDPLSSRSEQRDTIVVGEKSGYYKYTDSFAISSLDTMTINKKIEEFNELKTELLDNLPGTPGKNFTDTKFKLLYIESGALLEEFAGYTIPPTRDYASMWFDLLAANPKLKSVWTRTWNFLDNRLNYLIIAKHIVNQFTISADKPTEAIKQKIIGSIKFLASAEEKLIDHMQKFLKMAPNGDPTGLDLSNHKEKLYNFAAILYYMAKVTKEVGRSFWEIVPEDFYNIKVIKDNVDPAQFARDPRYKRIQQHHFVTDSYNLVTNMISLNSSFANMVNLYYFDNPKMITTAGIQRDDIDKLNMWSTKAFRGLRDEHIRPLNSFQKNIDPTWRDIAESNERYLAGYSRIWVDGISELSESKGRAKDVKLMNYLHGLYDDDFGSLNIHVPDWKHFPAYVVVGVNLLKKEVQQMYRGTIQIVGDTTIEPADIIHLEDYTNDMHGSFEVEEVIHSFTPQRGLTTTITPCLITYDRDPIMVEDLAVMNRIYNYAQLHRGSYTGKAIIGSTLTVGSILGFGLGAPFLGLEAGALGLPLLWNGITGLAVGNHKYLYDTMMNVMGGDVINYTALIHKGLPYVCGFDGIDYTNLKTLIQQRAEGVDGIINRLSVFSDPFSAVVANNLNTPQDFGPWQALKAHFNKNGFGRFFFGGLNNQGSLNDALNMWKRINPFDEWRF